MDDVGARRKEEHAAAGGVQGVTGCEDRGEISRRAIALRPVGSHVEDSLLRQVQRLVLNDHIIDDEVVDIAFGSATCVACFDAQDVPGRPQLVMRFDEEHIAVPGIPGRADRQSAVDLRSVDLQEVA